eukprot:2746154-Rhodomonas_salina.2
MQCPVLVYGTIQVLAYCMVLCDARYWHALRCAISGTKLQYGATQEGKIINHRWNFSSLFSSLLLLFRTTTGDDYFNLVYDCSIQVKFHTKKADGRCPVLGGGVKCCCLRTCYAMSGTDTRCLMLSDVMPGTEVLYRIMRTLGLCNLRYDTILVTDIPYGTAQRLVPTSDMVLPGSVLFYRNNGRRLRFGSAKPLPTL